MMMTDEPDREHVFLSHEHEDFLRLDHVGVSREALEIRPRLQTDEESSRRVMHGQVHLSPVCWSPRRTASL
jgi:hypothetical protein